MTALALAAVLQTSILAAGGSDLDLAVERSANNGRPVVVLLGATWCPGCRVMKNTVLPAVAKKGGLKDVEYVYVDVDEQPEVSRQLLRGNSIPQLVRLERSDDGWERKYLTGAQQPEKVADFIAGRKPSPLSLSSWLLPQTAKD